MRGRNAYLLLPFVAVLSACPSGNPAPSNGSASLWRDFLKRAAGNEAIGSHVVYFGTSNRVGPGSIWRKAQGGGYNLRAPFEDIVRDPAQRAQYIQPGSINTCAGNVKVGNNFGPSLELQVPGGPGGQVSADIKNAREVIVKTCTWRWDQIKEIDYENLVRQLKTAQSPYGVDLGRPERYVVGKALRIDGIDFEVKFDQATATRLQANLPQVIPSTNLGIGLNAQWTSGGTLRLSTNEEFVVAAQLYPWNESGAAGPPVLLITTSVPDVAAAALGEERIQPQP